MPETVLTLNSGSSSIKFSVFEITGRNALSLASLGEVEAIGSAPHMIVRDRAGTVLDEHRWPDSQQPFETVLERVLIWAESHLGTDALVAVGHRVVHGGPDHDRPERVTPLLLLALDRLTPLAPLHQPQNLSPMRAIASIWPDLPQVACFDTAFHHGMPPVATRFALPREYETAGVRRYGFHGLSFEYIARRLREVAPDLSKGRVITAHLGNGASLCAMRDGRSVDTTMGFTPLDGLVMGTRCGALDPGVILYLEQQRGLSPKQVEKILYERSGLIGVSGISSDMRVLLASKDPRAKEAIDLFVFHIAKEIGGLISSLGGIDGLVFTAGIGEHASEIRTHVCERLGWLGVRLNQEANALNAHRISAEESRVEVLVIPTNEEAMIARHALDTIRPASPAD